MNAYSVFPHLNAVLNAMSALLACIGFLLIRRRRIRWHRRFMLSAVVFSAGFLASYLLYHAEVGSVRLQKQGWIRPAYFTILISHSILAVVVLPLVGLTLRQAFAERFVRHARIARWTFPVWVYVSVTGVLVYAILYW